MTVHTIPEGVSVHDGFPNPATDLALQTLDLNSLLIKHPVSTYLMRIAGNDWTAQGIFDSDIAIIDRALVAGRNDLVAWHNEGSFAISPQHQLPVDATSFGVVRAIIHCYRGTEQ
jgi:DNA polymerase V